MIIPISMFYTPVGQYWLNCKSKYFINTIYIFIRIRELDFNLLIYYQSTCVYIML